MAFELLLAYTMDLVIGDPLWLPHPVRAIGRSISGLESSLRRIKIPLRLAGIILSLIVVIATYIIVLLLVQGAALLNPYLGKAVTIVFIFMSLSVRSLEQAARKVYLCLDKRDLYNARQCLGEIVSRDTAILDEDSIIRGTVETVAENTVDGIISPLFYAVIGGAPLAWAYKAINTLDSMVGYKNEKYRNLGWFAARCDDLANLVPARLSALTIGLGSLMTGNNAFQSLRTVLRDGRKAESPNAGFPEAAFAGALGIQLGGVNIYGGRPSERPLIGKPVRKRRPKDIIKAIHLMYAASAITLMAGIFAASYLEGLI